MDLSNNNNNNNNNTAWYQKTGFIILLLFLFFPVGLFLMWKYANWSKSIKIGVSAFFVGAVAVSAITPKGDYLTNTNTVNTNTQVQNGNISNYNSKTVTPQNNSNTTKGNQLTENSIDDKSNVNDNNKIFDFSNPDSSSLAQDINNLKIKHGKLLSVINNEGTVVVKTKIDASFSNKATIEQNYFTVADLVKNHGFNTCTELQYWAVADMQNGEESKCISFTLNKETIDNLYNGNIVENQLGNYADDLWILPSLQK